MRRVTKPLRSVRLVDIGHVVPYLLALKLAYRMLDSKSLLLSEDTPSICKILKSSSKSSTVRRSSSSSIMYAAALSD